LIDEVVEVLCKFAGDFARATGARAIAQALGSLMGEALHPCAQSRIRQVEGHGDGGDVLTRDHRTDGLRTAKDSRFLGLLEHGV
jgi:hypothetical protein